MKASVDEGGACALRHFQTPRFFTLLDLFRNSMFTLPPMTSQRRM